MNLFKLYGGDDHAHQSSVKHGSLINGSDLTAALAEFGHYLLTYADVAHLSSLKSHYDPDLISALQKLYGVAELGVKIVSIDTTGKLDLLELDDLLLFLGFLLLFVALETVFTVIHDAAYGRLSLRRHENKIVSLIVSYLKSGFGAHYSDGVSLNSYDSYFLSLDLLVDQ